MATSVRVRTNSAWAKGRMEKMERSATITVARRTMTVSDYLRRTVSRVDATHDRWRVRIAGCGFLAWIRS